MKYLNFFDLMAVVVLAVSVFSAMFKGLTIELFSLVAAVGGFFLAVCFYSDAAHFFSRMDLNPLLSSFLGFVAILLSVIVAGSGLALIMNRAIGKLGLNWIDHLLGGIFGLARGWLIVTALFLALRAFPIRNDLLSQSRLAEFFLIGARAVSVLTPEQFEKQFHAGYQKLYQMWIEQTTEAYEPVSDKTKN